MKRNLKLYLSFVLFHKTTLIIIFISCFVWIYISTAKIDVVSPGQGVITGENDKVIIKSPNSGFINNFTLHEGDRIEKGMVLFSYTNLDYTYKGKTLNDLIHFNKKKIKYLQKDCSLLEDLLTTQQQTKVSAPPISMELGTLNYLAFKEESSSIQNEQKYFDDKNQLINEEIRLRENQIAALQRKNLLLKKGGASDIDIINNISDIEQQKTDLINIKTNYLNLENELSNTRSQFRIKLLDKINNIKEQIEDLEKNNIENEGELKLMNNKVSTNSVTSPFTGKVLKIDNNLKEGSFIEQYQSIMTVKQDINGRVIEARFDAKYRPYLYEGADVKISVNSTAVKQSFSGKISKISPDSFVYDTKNMQSSEHRYYSATIDTFEHIEMSDLPEGIEVNVFATSAKVSILEYMIATLKFNFVFNVW